MSGHALRAMNDYRFEVTDEASLSMCEQIKDDQIIVIGPTRKKWSQFKLDHSDWIFESALNDDESNILYGKFLTVWANIGPELCQKYCMKYVIHNTPQKIVHDSFHYILLLDGSGSMRGKRCKDLLGDVKEFLASRLTLNTTDRITIIVFSDSASIECFDNEIQDVNIADVRFPDKGMSFQAAFTCANECITRSKSSSINDNYAIVFMSDGEDKYAEQELNQLSRDHDAFIKRFWTLSLSENRFHFK